MSLIGKSGMIWSSFQQLKKWQFPLSRPLPNFPRPLSRPWYHLDLILYICFHLLGQHASWPPVYDILSDIFVYSFRSVDIPEWNDYFLHMYSTTWGVHSLYCAGNIFLRDFFRLRKYHNMFPYGCAWLLGPTHHWICNNMLCVTFLRKQYTRVRFMWSTCFWLIFVAMSACLLVFFHWLSKTRCLHHPFWYAMFFFSTSLHD